MSTQIFYRFRKKSILGVAQIRTSESQRQLTLRKYDFFRTCITPKGLWKLDTIPINIIERADHFYASRVYGFQNWYIVSYVSTVLNTITCLFSPRKQFRGQCFKIRYIEEIQTLAFTWPAVAWGGIPGIDRSRAATFGLLASALALFFIFIKNAFGGWSYCWRGGFVLCAFYSRIQRRVSFTQRFCVCVKLIRCVARRPLFRGDYFLASAEMYKKRLMGSCLQRPRTVPRELSGARPGRKVARPYSRRLDIRYRRLVVVSVGRKLASYI